MEEDKKVIVLKDYQFKVAAEDAPSDEEVAIINNKKNKDRLERERLIANKKVLREYRIKHS